MKFNRNLWNWAWMNYVGLHHSQTILFIFQFVLLVLNKSIFVFILNITVDKIIVDKMQNQLIFEIIHEI